MMMARSITARIHKRVCNSHNTLVMKEGGTPTYNRTKARLAFRSVDYNCFGPILEVDKVLEFVSPSHSRIEWLDRPQE